MTDVDVGSGLTLDWFSSPVRPKAKSPPETIPSGIAQPGAVLSVTPDAVWETKGTPTITGQWTRDNAPISGETASIYNVVAGDVGSKIRYRSTCTDDRGTAFIDSAPVLIEPAS